MENFHTIAVLVENEFGVLARVAGMFAGRGFNIDALSVAPTRDPKISRITLITHGNEQIIEQILKQLNRLIDVLKVVDLSAEDSMSRELMLVKVRALQKTEQEAFSQVVQEFSGQLVDGEGKSIRIYEFIGKPSEIEALLAKLQTFDVLETVRTGDVAMQKGKKTLL